MKSKKYLDLTVTRSVFDQFVEDLLPLLETSRAADPYLKQHILSKYVDEKTDPADVRRTRAIVKWLGVELRNGRTTHRVWNSETSFTNIGTSTRILEEAGLIIRRIIGDTPPEDLLSRGGFSGGATTSVKRGVGTLQRKFVGKRDVTPQAYHHVIKQMTLCETWVAYNPEVLKPRLVRGNILFTVPKTSVIDRVACKEPDFNVFFQKAVGGYFRRRLKVKANINLNDQSVNRKLAYRGSIDGSLATIDLSSASDSLAAGLVTRLLPHDWVELLESLRSPKTFIDGMSHKNEMFSSMGNGFTFELESLIFYSLSRAVAKLSGTKGRISVYGDDIIVPTPMVKGLLNVLRWCGFTPNVQKTLIDGPLRESCGGHYHRGSDVTPFFLRRPWQNVSDVILTLNQYRRWIITTQADIDEDTVRPIEPDASALASTHVGIWTKYSSYVPKVLHGGWSLESRTQLASPEPQQCELLLLRNRKASERATDTLQLEAYLERLHALDRRVEPTLIDAESEIAVLTAKYQVRRCKFEPMVFGLAKPMFAYEHERKHGWFVYADSSAWTPRERWGET